MVILFLTVSRRKPSSLSLNGEKQSSLSVAYGDHLEVSYIKAFFYLANVGGHCPWFTLMEDGGGGLGL